MVALKTQFVKGDHAHRATKTPKSAIAGTISCAVDTTTNLKGPW